MNESNRMGTQGKRDCPGCLSSAAKPQGEKNGFEIYVCTKCRTIYTDRIPAGDEVENYDEYYSESNLTVPDFIIVRVNEILEPFAKYRSDSNRLLDIGFGAGTILDVAKSQGWNAFGQEVSSGAVKQAKEKGFDVFHGDLIAAEYPDDYFDVITCSEIIEHLPNPQEVLNEAARILRPGGLFWATTPSARGISFRTMNTAWSVLSPPEHTQLYSSLGIRKMLRSAGFSKVSIKLFGTNPGEILNYYKRNSSLAEPAANGFNRVGTSYALNAKLSSGTARRSIKWLLNNALNASGLGDSIKIFAVK